MENDLSKPNQTVFEQIKKLMTMETNTGQQEIFQRFLNTQNTDILSR